MKKNCDMCKKHIHEVGRLLRPKGFNCSLSVGRGTYNVLLCRGCREICRKELQ